VTLIHDPLFDQFDSLLHSQPQKEISIRATVRGRIFAMQQNFNGKNMVRGYGHMGCCMLLAVVQVVSVDSKKPEPSIFDLAHQQKRKSQ
jgi:hypothetical protein